MPIQQQDKSLKCTLLTGLFPVVRRSIFRTLQVGTRPIKTARFSERLHYTCFLYYCHIIKETFYSDNPAVNHFTTRTQQYKQLIKPTGVPPALVHFYTSPARWRLKETMAALVSSSNSE